MPPLLRALRPHQWTKNLFVLAALGGAYGDQEVVVDGTDLLRTVYAFAAFCLGASAIYLLNDVRDVESDRNHPEKCRRPIAAGELSIPSALVAAAACALAALGLSTLAGGGAPWVAVVVGAYMTMNLAYSLGLKKVVLLDVFIIATGFLFRVKAGGLAAGAEVSHWLMLCTFFLALFLAMNKRRAEISMLGDDKESHRANLREYDAGFLDQMITTLAASTIVCYALYTVDEETMEKFGEGNHLVWTVPFVVFGIARYMFLVHAKGGGGSPTKVLLGGDAWFLLNLCAWAAITAAVLFFGL